MNQAQIDILRDASHAIAERVRKGQMSFLEGVDFIWSAAEWSDLTDSEAVNQVQAVMAEAFMNAPREAAA